MRDLVRTREAAMLDLRCKRQQVSAFLLRQGRPYAGRNSWTKAHMNWLASQTFDYPQQRIAFEEMMLGIRQAQERLARLEQAIRGTVPDLSLAEGATALMAMRGIDLIAATGLLAEIGDPSRFRTPHELMAYLGTGAVGGFDRQHHQARPKAGNRRTRRMLVECSWSYEHPRGWGE
jgi:transposase